MLKVATFGLDASSYGGCVSRLL